MVKSTKEWEGQSLFEYPDCQVEIKVLRIRSTSGVTLPWHYHPVINAVVILKGDLDLYLVDGRTKTILTIEALVEVIIHFMHRKLLEMMILSWYFLMVEQSAVDDSIIRMKTITMHSKFTF